MALQRTAKSCGSDAPMLASSLREEAQATVSNKPGHRGEHEVRRKTIARGCRVISGVTVVTTLGCLFLSAPRLRARRAPGIPCALYSRRRERSCKTSGKIMPRECKGVSGECEGAAFSLVNLPLPAGRAMLRVPIITAGCGGMSLLILKFKPGIAWERSE